MTDDEAMFACRPNLLVRDLVASVDFYVGRLGFALGWWWSDPAGRFLAVGETAPGTALVGRDGVQILLTQKAGDFGTWLQIDVHTAEQVDALHA
jgi:catechol 2,3-dioxygenase-like lactoylglutathione lyase family enzyme